MPILPDKVIINDGRDRGNNAMIKGLGKSIQHRFDVLSSLCAEIEADTSLLKKTVDLRDKLKARCDEYNKAQEVYATAQRKYIAELDQCISETAELIDKHVLGQP